MLKPEHRLAADRRGLRYPSELLGNKTRLARPIRYFEPRGIKIGANFWLWSTACHRGARPLRARK
jgi:hypothetical protein